MLVKPSSQVAVAVVPGIAGLPEYVTLPEPRAPRSGHTTGRVLWEGAKPICCSWQTQLAGDGGRIRVPEPAFGAGHAKAAFPAPSQLVAFKQFIFRDLSDKRWVGEANPSHK